MESLTHSFKGTTAFPNIYANLFMQSALEMPFELFSLEE